MEQNTDYKIFDKKKDRFEPHKFSKFFLDDEKEMIFFSVLRIKKNWS